MKPLIKIETVPISIEYVERKTTHTSSQSARLKISHNNEKMMIQSNPINIPMVDSYEHGPSADWSNLTYTATANYSHDGNLSMDVQVENREKTAYQYHHINRGIDNIIDFIPQSQKSASYGFEGMKINFDMSRLSGGFPGADSIDASFLPPDLELKVVERPKVIIKYVGGPIYIPRSADPNYVAPENINQVFDGKPNLIDVKA